MVAGTSRRTIGFALLLALAAILGPARTSAAAADGWPEPEPRQSAEWSIALYLAADNDLEPDAWADIREIEASLAGIEASPHVVVLFDRKGGAELIEITPAGSRTIATLGEIDTGDRATLARFLGFAFKAYPGERTLVDLWNHGGGLRGVAWDYSTGHHLSPHDIHLAIENAATEAKWEDRRVDLLVFDACLMSMLEDLWEVRDVADYVVGAEVLVPDEGFPYPSILAYLAANQSAEPRDLGSYIVDAYLERYEKYPNNKVHLALVDEGALGLLMDCVNDLTDSLRVRLEDGFHGVIEGARSAAQVETTMWIKDYVDLGLFAYLVAQRSGDKELLTCAQELSAALEYALPSAGATRQGQLDKRLSNVTIYFPANGRTYLSADYHEGTPCFLDDSNWDELLWEFYGR